MYKVYMGSKYKRTLWFKNKVWNKNIKYKVVYKNYKLNKSMY